MTNKKNVHFTVDEVRSLFCSPLKEAAGSLGVSTTTLKYKCRQLGISKWPFRQLQSLRNQLREAETRLKMDITLHQKHQLEAKCLNLEESISLLLNPSPSSQSTVSSPSHSLSIAPSSSVKQVKKDALKRKRGEMQSAPSDEGHSVKDATWISPSWLDPFFQEFERSAKIQKIIPAPSASSSTLYKMSISYIVN